VNLRVEVVYATAESQTLVCVELAPGATIADAIAAARRKPEFEKLDVAGLRVGIFGKLAEAATRLADGDRVEIYRPLQVDPMQARRRRAQTKTQKTA
jgi:putative ubiquitin-RnfH superfamily antitoxin RatB of RatAB toxin-antitoxin module